MNQGDCWAFPGFSDEANIHTHGMTYRQWLVGMIAPSMNDEF